MAVRAVSVVLPLTLIIPDMTTRRALQPNQTYHQQTYTQTHL